MGNPVNFLTTKSQEYNPYLQQGTTTVAPQQQYGPRIPAENKGVSNAGSTDALTNMFSNMSILESPKAAQSTQVAQVQTPAINPFQQPVQPVQTTGPNALKDPSFQAAIANNRQLNPGIIGQNYATGTNNARNVPGGIAGFGLDYHA